MKQNTSTCLKSFLLPSKDVATYVETRTSHVQEGVLKLEGKELHRK
jgi:hypothetical protein